MVDRKVCVCVILKENQEKAHLPVSTCIYRTGALVRYIETSYPCDRFWVMLEQKERKNTCNKIKLFMFGILNYCMDQQNSWGIFFTIEQQRPFVCPRTCTCKWFISLFCGYHRAAPKPYTCILVANLNLPHYFIRSTRILF